MNKFAPVLIPTLNRFAHFKRCIDSLKMCANANSTDLIIALDYPAKEIHWTGYKNIQNLLDNIQGFKSVTVIKQDVNWGAEKNPKEAMKTIFEQYDRFIIAEDDCVFAPSFLNFVNLGLEVYQFRPDVFSISGYNSPFSMPSWYQKDAYLRRGFTGWGVGVWRNKWEKVDWSLSNFKSMLSTKETYKILKKDYQRYLPQLLKIRDTGHITGDGLLFLYLLHNNMYSIYPTKTRVRNTGHDGSGVNCGNNGTEYCNQIIYEGMENVLLPCNLQSDRKLDKYVLKQIQPAFIEKLKLKVPSALRKILKSIIVVR